MCSVLAIANQTVSPQPLTCLKHHCLQTVLHVLPTVSAPHGSSRGGSKELQGKAHLAPIKRGVPLFGGPVPMPLAAPARRGHSWQSRLMLQQTLQQHFHSKPLLGANFKHDHWAFVWTLHVALNSAFFWAKAHLLQTEALKEEHNSLS